MLAELPFTLWTPESWTESALSDPLALLNDHAHLEKKAASNALDMLLRWPEPVPPEGWVQAMTGISIDEVSHLNTVTRLLSRRGGRLTKAHRNAYAAALRGACRAGGGTPELIDRLLISALVEARSCERFHLLAQGAPDPELAKLYDGLYRSEAGHYRVFLKLAEELPRAWGVPERWAEMLETEARIIAAQPPGPSMHSGW